MKALRKEVDEILNKNLADAITAFEAERDQNFEELVALKKAVEKVEAEKADIMEARGKLNLRKATDLGEYNRLTQKLTWLDRQLNGNRQLKGKRGKIDALMVRLTELEIDPKTLTLLLLYRKKEGGKNEKG